MLDKNHLYDGRLRSLFTVKVFDTDMVPSIFGECQMVGWKREFPRFSSHGIIFATSLLPNPQEY